MLDIIVSVATFGPIVHDVADLLRHVLCNKSVPVDYRVPEGSTDAWIEEEINHSVELLPLKKWNDDDLPVAVAALELAFVPNDGINELDVLTVTNEFLELLGSSEVNTFDAPAPTSETSVIE